MQSIEPLLSRVHLLPDIWGEGAIFAFSGFDGPTCAALNFELTFGHDPFDLVIQTADAYLLKLRLAVSGFMPLLLDDTPPAHVDALERALRDGAAFGATCPIPSVALDEPTWSTDIWRGAAWINMNYMTIIGLARHGRTETATWLAERTLAFVQDAYARYGVLFEFFDARGQRPPPARDRKGPVSGVYDIRARYEVIRDYHWTAALCFDLMFRRLTFDV